MPNQSQLFSLDTVEASGLVCNLHSVNRTPRPRQAPTPACLWDRPKSQAAARAGLLKVLPSEPAHRCTPCQHRQWLLHCAAVTLATPSRAARAWIMEQGAAPKPCAAGQERSCSLFGETKIDWEVS